MDWAIKVFRADHGILSGEMFCRPWRTEAGLHVYTVHCQVLAATKYQGSPEFRSIVFPHHHVFRHVVSSVHWRLVWRNLTCLGCVIQPCVHRVTSRSKVRFSKFVFLGPPEWSIAQALLDDGMEPGQQEVQAGSLIWRLDAQSDQICHVLVV